MRLTKEMREYIIAHAMSKAFSARHKAHDKATTALADAVYRREYEAVGKLAEKLPENWCNTGSEIVIEAAGFDWRGREHKSSRLAMSKSRRMPRHQSSNPVKIGGAHPLNDMAQAVAEEYKAIRRDKEALRAKLTTLVYSVTTVPRLLELWPECKPLLPEAPKATTALVPVDLVPEVNALLGIKPKAHGARRQVSTAAIIDR